MSLLELIIELSLDLSAVVLGILLVIRTKDNQHRLYWGIISVMIGIFFTWENISWIFTVVQNPGYEYFEILNIEKMMKWFAPACIISLFPLASLRPGYLNKKRVTIYLLPYFSILAITVCYFSSDGIITKIDSITQIAQNINKFDVKLRMLIFILSIVIPLTYFLYPLFNYNSHRKISPIMYLFFGFIFAILGLYILFTLYINVFFFNGFGITSILFAITFSTLYLHSENPLSFHPGDINKDTSSTHEVLPLYFEIEKHLNEKQSFVDSNFNITELAESLGEKESNVSDAIKSAGFTGFREYLNYMRLAHFKALVSQNSQATVKELMFSCGFTSRTTFYRIFSERYGISPTKYIDNHQNK